MCFTYITRIFPNSVLSNNATFRGVSVLQKYADKEVTKPN